MIHKKGDLFTTDATYIGHGVNCEGVMGAGIAKVFKERYPVNYDKYRDACKAGRLTPGGFMVVPEQRDSGRLVLITNFASQNEPGANATYKWLFSSLWLWAEQASKLDRLRLYGGTIAVPEIGCGIGGLEWDKVEIIIEAIEHCFPDIEFEVWHYAG